MLVSDIMTKKLFTVQPTTRIEEAIRLMLGHGISGLPVTDETGNLIGVITEGDLLRRAEIGTEKEHTNWLSFLISQGRLARDYVSSHAHKVSDVMTTQVVSVAPTATLEEVVELMERHSIKRLPVLQGDQLVGMVTRASLLKAMLGLLTADANASDEEIRQVVLYEIDKQPWAPRSTIDVTVADGIVEFSGAILDDRIRDALRVVAENAPGVKGVRDRLVWVEPLSGIVLNAPGDKK